ncbi:thioredoxin family protein [Sphingobacterium olei]|uniref:Thioredoxin family protein n=1 Tax=Sphingobacterium olei TaxID=2571155 RepID=A0A4U0PGV4_9SPHI|nr:thioredoxin family protein [Sphingobacterium olei]TJZ62024.1 thioredoxin family protein [Sphingobacterium olei]
MTFEEYLTYFEAILTNPADHPTYADPEYLSYTKLNWSRMNRWLKKFEANTHAKSIIHTIQQPQHWILITEPWCGDAAHSVPQIYNMVKDNPHIQLDLQLRDSPPLLINDYLTNGGKSIPKLVIRNAADEDLATWGPRPEKADVLFQSMKSEEKSFNEIKEALQRWYNEDKGQEIQNELVALLVTGN